MYNEVDSEILHSHTLIINTTPLGMYPNIDSFPDLPYNFIGSDHFLYDLVYNLQKLYSLVKERRRVLLSKTAMKC
jgi:shikimate dehydrogenase